MKLYNTLTNNKEKLIPIKKNIVKLYVCGITPYDTCHMGHARIFVIFDTLIRYLKNKKIKIIYTQNITDIDDKIITKAREKKTTPKKITNIYIKKMKKITKKLNILKPTYNPLVTNFIKQIIKYIINLYTRGYAYIEKSGDICYKIKKNKQYGILSNRIKTTCIRNNFVLWKKFKKNEPYWNTPFGKGRPGWHIECTTLATHFLGENFDIHGGGIDLLFPHHENELAQAHIIKKKKKFANTWMHIGLLQINKKKMSKTNKNYNPLSSLITTLSSDSIRYYLLTKNYHKPIEYKLDKLKQCEKIITKFYKTLMLLKNNPNAVPTIKKNTRFETNFRNAIENNMDTPKALSILNLILKKINNTYYTKEKKKALVLCKLLKYLGNIIGLFSQNQEKTLLKQKPTKKINIIKTITKLLKKRNVERQNKNWKNADIIRQEIYDLYKIKLKDTINKTTWYHSP